MSIAGDHMNVVEICRSSGLYKLMRNTFPFRVGRCLKYQWFPPVFQWVQVETTTTCNRRCAYCPNSTIGRPECLMDEAVFFKIIDALRERDPRRTASLEGIMFSGFGEPLMDVRLPRFLAYAKRQLPDAHLIIFTNGDFLTVDAYAALKNSGAGTFVVSQHAHTLPETTAATLEKIREKFPDTHGIRIEDTYHDKLKINRGGLVPIATVRRTSCTFPRWLTFDYAGNIILCCSDYLSSVVFGNIKRDNLYTVWFSHGYVNIRSKIISGFFPYAMCRKCSRG